MYAGIAQTPAEKAAFCLRKSYSPGTASTTNIPKSMRVKASGGGYVTSIHTVAATLHTESWKRRKGYELRATCIPTFARSLFNTSTPAHHFFFAGIDACGLTHPV